MAIHIHQLDELVHEGFLSQKRRDPVTSEPICHGDRVVICATCESAFLESSWSGTLLGIHCNQSNTKSELPLNEAISFAAPSFRRNSVVETRYRDNSANAGLITYSVFASILSFIGITFCFNLLEQRKSAIHELEKSERDIKYLIEESKKQNSKIDRLEKSLELTKKFNAYQIIEAQQKYVLLIDNTPFFQIKNVLISNVNYKGEILEKNSKRFSRTTARYIKFEINFISSSNSKFFYYNGRLGVKYITQDGELSTGQISKENFSFTLDNVNISNNSTVEQSWGQDKINYQIGEHTIEFWWQASGKTEWIRLGKVRFTIY